MAPEPTQAILAILSALELSSETQASLLEAFREANARTLELAEDVADLGRRLAIAELAVSGVKAELAEEIQELHARITTVHNQALRELTRRAERSTTA